MGKKRTLIYTIFLSSIIGTQGIASSPSPAPPPTGTLYPPANFKAVCHEIGVLGKTVYYNQLDWQMPDLGNVPTSGYLIYKDGILVDALSAQEFTWQDLDIPQEEESSVTYTIISLAGTTQSSPISIRVVRLQ